MPKFMNKKTYFPQLQFRDDGKNYLVSPDFEQELSLGDMKDFVLKYTLASGRTLAQFRIVEYPTGEKMYLSKNDDDFKISAKKERIRIKDINCGDILIDKRQKRYVFLGAFYFSDEKIFAFKELSSGNITYEAGASKFIDFVDFLGEYSDIKENLKNHFNYRKPTIYKEN